MIDHASEHPPGSPASGQGPSRSDFPKTSEAMLWQENPCGDAGKAGSCVKSQSTEWDGSPNEQIG
ncbi:MAG: hypothetical protein CMM00_10850 [Rhodopirellula sp.]|nr:hypothetical protein [Rhodopirellula sp.]